MNDEEAVNFLIGACISADNNQSIADRQNNIASLKKLAQASKLTDYQVEAIANGIGLLENEIAEELKK